MPSGTTVKRLIDRPAPHPVAEFLSALTEGHTYSPTRNAYAIFGFLWGLPIPFFSIWIDLWVTGRTFSPSILLDHPIHWFFLFHPALFAVVFGAMGSVRRRKEFQIQRLIVTLREHVRELASANDRLKELDHLKAEFMANVTHELKTPLVAIRGYNEAILEGRFGPIQEKQRDGLRVAVRNADRLQKLIEELLDFERIDSGNLKLDLSEFDLVPVIDSVLRDHRPHIDSKGLILERRFPDSLRVRGDREKIRHVLLNLVSNAVKFTEGKKAIGVNAHAGEDGQAFITIWDRGSGIPTAAQKFLFTRFWQADSSPRRRTGGTGLGLAVCKGILDAHGSEIHIVSTEEAGTMVHFSLPLAEESHAVLQTAHPRR